LGPAIRRLFDSLEILSTVSRRLDLYVMSGRLTASTEAQLWELVFKMADNALVDKARGFRETLRATEGEDSELAYALAKRLRKASSESDAAFDIEIEKCRAIAR